MVIEEKQEASDVQCTKSRAWEDLRKELLAEMTCI